jgi:hypothetical protein
MTIQTIEEAGKIFGAALNGDRTAQGRVKALVDGTAYITESFSTSDLAAAFGIGVSQKLQAQYAERTQTWKDFAVKLTFNDFKPQWFRELTLDDDVNLDENGGAKTKPNSLPRIPEGTEYPSFGFTTSASGIMLYKEGARFPFTWEMVINDEWSLIKSIPGKMLDLAANTEDTEAYGILAGVNGPNSVSFSADHGNINDSNSLFAAEHPLSLDALVLAKKAIRARKVNGRRVTVPKFRLLVPTTMKDQAESLLAISEYTTRNADNTKEIKVRPTNSDVALTASDWLTDIDQSASADTTWYLVPDGGKDGTRDALGVAFLQNHEAPELRISGNGGNYLGGGQVPGMEGSLLNDTSEYRVRHVVAGAFLNGQGLLASKGTGAAAPSQFSTP